MAVVAGSAALIARARRAMPGGVSSPVRAFGSVGGEPFFVERGQGAELYDTDGGRFVDFVMSWGALMLGHAHPAIVRAVSEAAARGTSYGAPTRTEVELAELICDAMPSIEMVRFVNSGTEATMSAVRLARAATGRDLIVKCAGCYHGHADGFLSHAGSGMATLGLPASPGVPAPVAELTVTVPFNDASALRDAFDAMADRIAAVIIEPICGNAGMIPPLPGYLDEVRSISRGHGALLILDEVMTGFRVGWGGAQERYGVEPDLTTLGKVIGGGLPVGAYGGSRSLMEQVAPAGRVYQAGTLSGNPLAMAAGLTQLRVLREDPPYARLEEAGQTIVRSLRESAAHSEQRAPVWGTAAGAMFGFFFAQGPVENFEQARAADASRFQRLHGAALRHGVFLPPSPFEAMFLSTAHDEDVVERAMEALGAALAEAGE